MHTPTGIITPTRG